MPEWWLDLISPLVTDYCILRHGSEFGCQLNYTLIFALIPIALIGIPLLQWYRKRNK